MVGVHRLAAQVVGPPGPAGAVQMAVLRVSVAHTLSGVAAILFELFGSFGTVFSGPLGRFLQPLLPVGVQTVSIIPWALLELHQLLRGTGGIGLHISRYPSRPVTGPFGTHWRTISSNSRRKLLPKEGFLHRSWETVLWSGTRSRRSSPSTSELGTLSAASSWPEVPEGLGAPQQAFLWCKNGKCLYTCLA